MSRIIDVHNLSKSYGEIKAVQGINFYVEEGALFAHLGKNGAGKTTTIEMLTTLLQPDSGEVIIHGHTLGRQDGEIRKAIGIVFQNSLLDNGLTVEENLMTRGGLYGLTPSQQRERTSSAMDTVGIAHLAKRLYGKLSGGQRRAADIARALINQPKILFLDEPTTGLDPETRSSVWSTVSRLRDESAMTVFLTTHYMEEAAKADYVTIMGQGKILDQGTPLELKNRHTTDRLILLPKNRDALAAYAAANGLELIGLGKQLSIPLNSSVEAISILKAQEDNILSFEVLHGTMDEAFLSVIA